MVQLHDTADPISLHHNHPTSPRAFTSSTKAPNMPTKAPSQPPAPGAGKPPASAAVYQSVFMPIYDTWVLRVSSSLAWRCPTASVQLPLFRRHVGGAGGAHLDVGVGSGYYLARSADLLRAKERAVLLDVIPETLALAAARLRRQLDRTGGQPRVETVLQDVTKPWAEEEGGGKKFTSISLVYVLHCLGGEGGIGAKVDAVSACLKGHLEPEGGVLFGSTVLGDEVGHNLFGRLLMWLYNRKGFFGNQGDKEEDLREALGRHFREVEVTRVGKVALFEAKVPIFGPK